MPRKAGSVLVVGFKFFHREEAAFGKRCIDARAGMPFGKNESVTVFILRVLGVDAQHLGIELTHNIGNAQNGSQVRAAGEMCHLHAVPSD